MIAADEGIVNRFRFGRIAVFSRRKFTIFSVCYRYRFPTRKTRENRDGGKPAAVQAKTQRNFPTPFAFPQIRAIIMSTESTAKWLIRAAIAAQFHKTAQRSCFMAFSHCYHAYCLRCSAAHRRKVQGFWTFPSKTLALGQSHVALKVSTFRACSFVPYAL